MSRRSRAACSRPSGSRRPASAPTRVPSGAPWRPSRPSLARRRSRRLRRRLAPGRPGTQAGMAQLERRGHSPETSTAATFKRTLREFSEDHGTDWAAALTYYGLLALFPAIIALVSIVGLVFDPATITKTLTDTIAQIGPASAVKTFQGPIESVTSNKGGAGIALVLSTLL